MRFFLMKPFIGVFIGLLLSVSVSAEPLLEGRVRLSSGESVADAQVQIFDLADLRRGPIARATTDGTGYFALPIAALSGSVLPASFALGPNYPNPFNPATIIPYQLAASSQVRLEVFNLLGQRIATLVDGARPAGFHTTQWHATDAAGRAVAAGVYIYRMTVGVESQTGRMVLIDGQAGLAAGGAASVMPGASGVGVSNEAEAQVYGLVVSGSGLAPYVDSSFRVEAGMAPVELVVSAGSHSAGKVADDDCAFCDLLDMFNDQQEEEETTEEEEETTEEEEETTEEEEETTEEEEETTEEEEETTEDVADDALVTIPDANLRAGIEAALGKASGATITKGEMTTLTTLRLAWDDISDLTGLEFATNLTELNLIYNDLSDISALRGLTNLTSLDLGDNDLSDISALRGLTNLTELSLIRNNDISDISALSGLTNLTTLEIDPEHLSDIPALLSSLTNLTTLQVDYDVIINLSDLTITDDPTPVTIPDANLRAGIEAALGKAPGATITKGDMTRLFRLPLGRDVTDLTDLTGLEFATNLLYLDSDDPFPDVRHISDISALRGLTNLVYLDLRFNYISDVSPLAGLTNLTDLLLSDNTISDVSPLAGLTNLTGLWLSDNTISDVSPLAGLTNLRSLFLEHNDISDLSPLMGLPNLLYLNLENNYISDIPPLGAWPELVQLVLKDNAISDISPLLGLVNLRSLDLSNQPLSVSSLTINDHIPALQDRGVRVMFDTPLRESDFDIELVFLDDHFGEKDKRRIRYAARRWESIIREDLPDYTWEGNDLSRTCFGQSYSLRSGERIDDLRIYVVGEETGRGFGAAGTELVRETLMPVVGCVVLKQTSFWKDFGSGSFRLTLPLHEIGHVLGIGAGTIIVYSTSGTVLEAIGKAWKGFQISSDDPHFNGPRAIAAFDDAGGRNYPGAKVPLEGNGQHWRNSVLTGELMDPVINWRPVLSAITIQALADLGYVVDVSQADPYTLLNARAAKVAALPGDPLTRRQAPHPPLSCGGVQHQEPILVVDPQGRIVRTISP